MHYDLYDHDQTAKTNGRKLKKKHQHENLKFWIYPVVKRRGQKRVLTTDKHVHRGNVKAKSCLPQNVPIQLIIGSLSYQQDLVCKK